MGPDREPDNRSYFFVGECDSAGEQIAERVAGADIVVVRYLGSPQGLWEGFTDLRTAGAPLVVLGGTQDASEQSRMLHGFAEAMGRSGASPAAEIAALAALWLALAVFLGRSSMARVGTSQGALVISAGAILVAIGALLMRRRRA